MAHQESTGSVNIGRQSSRNSSLSSTKRSMVYSTQYGQESSLTDGYTDIVDDDNDDAITLEARDNMLIEKIRDRFVNFILEIRDRGLPFFNQPSSTVGAFEELVNSR